MQVARRQLQPVDADEFGMAGEVIGPVSGNAAAAFGPQRAAQLADNVAASLCAFIIQLVRPQRQDARKFDAAVIGSRVYPD